MTGGHIKIKFLQAHINFICANLNFMNEDNELFDNICQRSHLRYHWTHILNSKVVHRINIFAG